MSISLRTARRVTTTSITGSPSTYSSVARTALAQAYSSEANSGASTPQNGSVISSSKASEAPIQEKKKTQAELDKELELKMKGLAGDGGESGVEFEDGQPVAMKRSVKNNMFRYI